MSQAITEVRPASVGRIPPQNLDAERSVLGGILLESSAFDEVQEIVKPEDFYREAHRKVFEAMRSLSLKSEPIDRVTVKDALTAQGAFASIGGDDFIDLLDKVVPVTTNVAWYARIVHEKAVARRLIEAAQAIAAQGYEQAGEVGDFLDDAQRRIFSIAEEGTAQGFEPVQTIVKSAFKQIESLYARQEEITGISTGFADLDRLTSGFQPGDLVILAARPSMGKTAFCLNIAAHAAIRARFNSKKIGVAIFSLEMPSVQLVMRMLASEARVDAQRLRTGRLIESDWPKLAHAAGQLAETVMHIDESPGLTALDLRTKCRRLAAKLLNTEAPLGLIIIDYLQLMKGNERIDSREQQISEISRSLKGLAKELKIPVLALSQLNRSLEKRPDKRPIMSDLRECVTGDTRVVLADGRRVPIASLVGQEPRVLAVDESGKIIEAASDKVWKVGEREVFEVAFASGRKLRCTAKHRLYGRESWKRVAELQLGDQLASTNVDTLHSELMGKAASDLFWDRVVAVTPAGREEVYDLTVPGPASWLADGIVSHNSGAIEQDADTICFLYREEVYEKDNENVKGVAEVIIGKQRNGPIGTANVAFLHEFTRFENLAREYTPSGGE